MNLIISVGILSTEEKEELQLLTGSDDFTRRKSYEEWYYNGPQKVGANPTVNDLIKLSETFFVKIYSHGIEVSN